jgi:hypothetical protein
VTQAPATSKAKRGALRAAAALAPGLARHLSPAPSERAALAARDRPLARPEAPEVVFLIPLVGRHQVGDWAAVSARLARTVESFRRQSSPRWRALVCGQDAPEGLPADERVRLLPFAARPAGNDKWAKLAALARALPGQGVTRGYAMPFDADDLLAPDAVEEMVARRARGGYLATRGYVMDAGAGLWAEARPQSLAEPGQKAFWKLCGSCAAFGFDLRETAQDAALIGAITAHEHRMFPYLARLAGRPLAPLHGPAALYIVNHGENFGARRGRTGFKTRFVRRFALSGAAAARARATFGADAAHPGVALAPGSG